MHHLHQDYLGEEAELLGSLIPVSVTALRRGSPALEDSIETEEACCTRGRRLERHQRNQYDAAGERLLPTETLISSLDGFLHRRWVAEGSEAG